MLDERARAALGAVPMDILGSDVEKFCAVIVERYQDGAGPPLAEFVGSIDPGLARAAEQFQYALRAAGLDGDWPEIAAAWIRDGGNTGSAIVALHQEHANPTARPAPTVLDWAAFTRANNDFWATWTGADWDTWRDAFLARVPSELAADAAPLVRYLDGLRDDPAAQLTYLRDTLEFAIDERSLDYHRSDASGRDNPATMDWNAFVLANKDFWTDWAGTDWNAWRDAFLARVPPELTAEVTAQIEYVDSLRDDPPAQVARLRALGFTLNHEPTPASPQPQPTPEQVEQVGAGFAAAANLLADDDEALLPAGFATELLAEVPGAAGLDPADIQEVMRRVNAARAG